MAKVNNQDAINTTVIMHNMTIDLCQNSSIEKGLCLSQQMAAQLAEIKKFNYEYIYKNKKFEPFKKYSELIICQLFESLSGYYSGEDTIRNLNDIRFDGKLFVEEFARWLVRYCAIDFSEIKWAKDISARCSNRKIYADLSDKKVYMQAVIDYIAGMTDHYAIHAFHELLEC
jgi:dGTPase